PFLRIRFPPYRAGNDDRTISNALGYLDKNHHPAGSTRPAGPGADTPLVTTHGHRQGGFHGELATVDYASPPVPRPGSPCGEPVEGGGLLPTAADPDGRSTAGRPVRLSRARCPVHPAATRSRAAARHLPAADPDGR